jgi:hypothetical protein
MMKLKMKLKLGFQELTIHSTNFQSTAACWSLEIK